jgi:8-oxo-dGTP diphosphatase
MNSVTSVVAAVIEDAAGRVLLCQQSHGHRLWGLPGGRIRPGESPVHAAIRDIREETGTDVELVDLVGLYTLTDAGPSPAGLSAADAGLPDVMVHVFRVRFTGEATLNAPGKICRLSWYDAASLPQPVTATARWAVVDALAGRSGVLRRVVRDPEPAVEAEALVAEPEPAPA